ncbi:hypothetical protein [Pedobacter heparinus]|uniref:hypothetical protein n=1 Tax=Pedobacter heparinus TaxID=984 RepID=UPI002931254F|nr:hypothetical protein [Pedobacter heparinus]
MFNLFKKRQNKLHHHQYKNLSIELPSHWKYELEEGEQQSCYDPKSQSTLRINIIKAIPPQQSDDEAIKALTDNLPYVTTSKGYLLTNPTYFDTTENGINITLVTWRLINHKTAQKIIAVLTYTVLSAEINSAQEKEAISMIENSIQNADLE